MRVLHVIRSADPAGGGPIESVIRLGLEHARRRSSVEVATLDAPGAPWLDRFPLPVHALGPVSSNYGYTSRLGPWLERHVRSYDIVIVNGLWQYPGLAVWRALRTSGPPYVVFPHGMLDPWFKRRYPLKHAKKWLYWPWAEYRVLRDAAAVLFTTEEERLLARESFSLYRCKERVVTFGTEAPPEETAAHGRRFGQAYAETEGRRLILFLGRIHEKKGVDLLVRAFGSAVRSAPPDEAWHLVLAGPCATNGYRRLLDRLVEEADVVERVTWTGMLSGDLKWSAFRAADVFILPSHQENFGVAVAEALACGVPTLISDKVNIWREIVTDGAGLVDADSQEGIDRLLRRWMSLDEVSRHAMRVNALRCFRNRFDARDAAVRLDAVLDELVR